MQELAEAQTYAHKIADSVGAQGDTIRLSRFHLEHLVADAYLDGQIAALKGRMAVMDAKLPEPATV